MGHHACDESRVRPATGPRQRHDSEGGALLGKHGHGMKIKHDHEEGFERIYGTAQEVKVRAPGRVRFLFGGSVPTLAPGSTRTHSMPISESISVPGSAIWTFGRNAFRGVIDDRRARYPLAPGHRRSWWDSGRCWPG